MYDLSFADFYRDIIRERFFVQAVLAKIIQFFSRKA